MKKPFLYKSISETIKSWIDAGKFDEQKQLPKTIDLAKQFETSPVTINKALDLLVDEGLISRAPGRGTHLNSFKDSQKSNSNNPGSGIIGAIVYDTSGNFLWAHSLRGIEKALQKHGFGLMVGNDEGDFRKAEEYIDTFAMRNIDGLIYVPIGHQQYSEYEALNAALLQRIESHGIPYILYHRFLDTKQAHVVAMDDYSDTIRLMDHFLTPEKQYPVCLSHYYTSCSAVREQAFQNSLHRYGYDTTRQSIWRLRPFGQRVDNRVKDSIRGILLENPDIDSIFTIENDILAVTREVIINDAVLSKRQYSFCCFDYSGTLDGTSATSVMQIPTFTLGYVAGEFMARKIQEPEIIPYKMLLSSKLIT